MSSGEILKQNVGGKAHWRKTNSDADKIDAKKTVAFKKLASRWEKMESKRGGFGKNLEKGKKKGR